MPKPGAERVPEAAGSSLIEREFRPLFHHLAGERADYQDIVAALSREETRAGRDVRAELLRLAAAETLRG
jgi:hypothetical protein